MGELGLKVFFKTMDISHVLGKNKRLYYSVCGFRTFFTVSSNFLLHQILGFCTRGVTGVQFTWRRDEMSPGRHPGPGQYRRIKDSNFVLLRKVRKKRLVSYLVSLLSIYPSIYQSVSRFVSRSVSLSKAKINTCIKIYYATFVSIVRRSKTTTLKIDILADESSPDERRALLLKVN